jgi:hypothetical protein
MLGLPVAPLTGQDRPAAARHLIGPRTGLCVGHEVFTSSCSLWIEDKREACERSSTTLTAGLPDIERLLVEKCTVCRPFKGLAQRRQTAAALLRRPGRSWSRGHVTSPSPARQQSGLAPCSRARTPTGLCGPMVLVALVLHKIAMRCNVEVLAASTLLSTAKRRCTWTVQSHPNRACKAHASQRDMCDTGPCFFVFPG